MISARLALIAWAVIGPLLAAGIMWGREHVMVSGAVTVERNKGVVACNARVATIETTTNRASLDAVERATTAAREMLPTPSEMVALQKICDASPACRSRRPNP